jgi:hypothetical protein
MMRTDSTCESLIDPHLGVFQGLQSEHDISEDEKGFGNPWLSANRDNQSRETHDLLVIENETFFPQVDSCHPLPVRSLTPFSL